VFCMSMCIEYCSWLSTLAYTNSFPHQLRSKLKGCEAEVAALLDSEWQYIAYEWTLDSPSPEKPLLPSPTSQSKSIAFDDRRV